MVPPNENVAAVPVNDDEQPSFFSRFKWVILAWAGSNLISE